MQSTPYIHHGNPQLNLIYRHFLFAAALVVQSNEFASLHKNPVYADTFQKAMSIMNYCAKSDPQASRLVYILTTFNHVIVSRAPGASSLRDNTSIATSANTPVPNTPTGAMSNSSNDPMANFFLSHSNAPVPVPGGNFNPTASQQQQHAQDLARRNSTNLTSAPSPSSGVMQTAITPTTSAAGDLLPDAEWFHFDSLWDNWATPGNGSGATGAAPAVTDPALFNDSTLNNFDVPVTTSAFATPPIPPSQQPDARFNGSGGGMQIPLYPMMRFTE